MATIQAYEIFKHAYDLGGYKLSYGEQNEVDAIVVIIDSDDGHRGYGEANPWQPFTRESADDVFSALENRLLPAVKALNSTDPWRVQRFFDETPEEDLIAKGAINMALMDLEGKRQNKPVAELLGPILRRAIEVSRPLNNGTAEDVIPVIDQALAEGYRHFMLKAGSKEFPANGEIPRLAKLQQRYGDKAVFKIDANTGWPKEDARAFFKGLPDYLGDGYLRYVEEPIAKEDNSGVAELQKMTDVPIFADERLTGVASAKELIADKVVRGFSIKISKNGGILNAQAIARLGMEAGMLIYPNSMAEGGITQASSLHLIATVGNLVDAGGSYRSVLRLGGRDVTNFHEFIARDGDGLVKVHLPEGPGLGIKIDEQKLRAGAKKTCHS
jgi:muconate cycloisomerase